MKNLEAQRAEIARAGKDMAALPLWYRERDDGAVHAHHERLHAYAQRHNVVFGDFDKAAWALEKCEAYVEHARERIADWASDYAGELQA